MVKVPRLTPDQQAYIDRVGLTPEPVDLSIMIVGRQPKAHPMTDDTTPSLVERLLDPNYAESLQHLRSWQDIDDLFKEAASRITELEGRLHTPPSPVEGREVIEAAYFGALHADLVMVQVPTAFLGNVLNSTMYSAAEANWRYMLTEAEARAEAAEQYACILIEEKQAAEANARRLEIDAARYRHLRDRDAGPPEHTPPGLFIGLVPENLILTGVDADEAVDAALTTKEADRGPE